MTRLQEEWPSTGFSFGLQKKCVTPSRPPEANLSKHQLRLPGEPKRFEGIAVSSIGFIATRSSASPWLA